MSASFASSTHLIVDNKARLITDVDGSVLARVTRWWSEAELPKYVSHRAYDAEDGSRMFSELSRSSLSGDETTVIDAEGQQVGLVDKGVVIVRGERVGSIAQERKLTYRNRWHLFDTGGVQLVHITP